MNQGYQAPNSNMQSNFGYYIPNYNTLSNNSGDERLAGSFVFPFLLGGVTGAALAPNFWRPPTYYLYPPMPPRPYPPRRWF